MSPRRRNLAVILGVVVLLASPLAACAAEALAPVAQQMTCCDAEIRDCGAVMTAGACCTHADPHQNQLRASKVELVQRHIVSMILAVHPVDSSLGIVPGLRVDSRGLVPTTTGPPDCVAFSAL